MHFSVQHQVKFSIIISTFNRAHTLLFNLDRLAGQTRPGTIGEVIVISDGCTDHTARMLEQKANELPFPLIHIALPVTSPKVFNFAYAHNLGIEKASFDWLFFLDDDAIPPPDLLEQHLNFHARIRETCQCDAAVIGATLEGCDPDRLGTFSIEQIAAADFHFARNRARWDQLGPEDFITNNLSLTKSYVTEVGGFPVETDYWKGLDVALGMRIHARFPELRFVYGYTAITAHTIMHPTDFKSARDLTPTPLPPPIAQWMIHKALLYRDVLGIDMLGHRGLALTPVSE